MTKLLENYEMCEDTIRKLYDSKLRLSILDALTAGPLRLADLRRAVEANAPNTSAKAKELKDMGLLERADGNFQLTPYGKAVAQRVKDSFDFYATYEKFRLYWETHHLETIPTEFLMRLGDWHNSEMVSCTADNPIRTHELLVDYLQTVKKEIYVVSPVMQKEWSPILAKLAASGVKQKGVFSDKILELFAKIAEENNALELFEPTEFHAVPNDMPIPAILCSDTFACFSIESKTIPNNYMDVKLYSKDQKSTQWSKDIYEYFKKKAKKVKLEDYL